MEPNPCWKGYEPIGRKVKNGKGVPNCVPTRKKAKTIAGSKAKAIAGILYLEGCGHCHALLDPTAAGPSIFDSVKGKVQGKGNVRLVKIEASDEATALKRLGLEGKVTAQGGYPTLFRHEHGKTTYFLGGEPRSKDNLVAFFLNTKPKARATRTRRTTRTKSSPKHKTTSMFGKLF